MSPRYQAWQLWISKDRKVRGQTVHLREARRRKPTCNTVRPSIMKVFL